MRHRKKFNHLGRKKAHRKAMLSNMAISLIEHKRIRTTVAKAKALRTFVEPLLNRAKTDSQHSRRMVFRHLQSKSAVNELFREIAPKIEGRNGGYTRILKTGNRLGDNAEMCIIELVDYNELYSVKKSEKAKAKKTRRGRSKSKPTGTEANAQVEAQAQEVSENTESENTKEVSENTEESTTENKD